MKYVIAHFNHNGASFTLVTYKGRQYWLAHEVFHFLGIKEPRKAIIAAGLESKDYIALSGPQLADFKVALALKIRLSTFYLLTLAGMFGVLFNSRKPKAKGLRLNMLRALEKKGGFGIDAPNPARWRTLFRLLKQRMEGSKAAAAILEQRGFLPGKLPQPFNVEPPFEVHADLAALVEAGEPTAVQIASEVMTVRLPPELQMSLPGVD